MDINLRERAKHMAQMEKLKDEFCAQLKKKFEDKKLNFDYMELKTFTNRKNLCEILRSKGDPQLTTVINIANACGYKVVLVPAEPNNQQ